MAAFPKGKWSQTPGAIHWGAALNTSLTTTSNTDMLRDTLSSPTRKHSTVTRSGASKVSLNFYDYAEEILSEEKVISWLEMDTSHGVLRVYQPGSTYSELIKCTIETNAEMVMSKCVATELYTHLSGKLTEALPLDCYPLEIQNCFLQAIGHSSPERIQLEGIQEDLHFMFKLTAGKEQEKIEDRVQLTCTIKVKELGPFGYWSRRFCVLCGTKLHIFSSTNPKGKPSTVLTLVGSKVTEHEDKKHFYCIQITAGKKTVLLSFKTRFEQSVWLKRAAKLVTRSSLEVNLSHCSLEEVPKYLFLNQDLAAINLSHNRLQEMAEGDLEPTGCINDLRRFSNLQVLSLANNNLCYFPKSVCDIATLKELDLSSNQIRVIPQEIRRMKGLTTLLLHSNQLSNLPYQLNELHRLSTLVIAFNRFLTLPHIVKGLESLKILIAAGNSISSIPEDIHRILTLQLLDVRLNCINVDLPSTTSELHNFVSLNIRGNGLTVLDTKKICRMQLLNCADNHLKVLTLHKGRLKTLIARNNGLARVSMPHACTNLISIDLSKNDLITIPEIFSQLLLLEKLLVNNNKLTFLPKHLLRSALKLRVLQAANNSLIELPKVGQTCALEVLDVHSNRISQLPHNLLDSCQRLRELNISSNPLTQLPTLHSDHNLTELKAANCSLSSSALQMLNQLPHLTLLHLAYNLIDAAPPEVFSSLTKLEYLNLSGNQLRAFSIPLSCKSRLKCLSLHSNALRQLQDLSKCLALESIDLACNELIKMPQLDSLWLLKSIDLSGNSLLEVKESDAELLKRLQYVNLEGVELVCEPLRAVGNHNIDTGNNWSAEKFTFGSSIARGTSLEKTMTRSLYQIKMPEFGQNRNEAMFAIMDGGRAPDAPKALRGLLANTLLDEIAAGKNNSNNPLQYLQHTFLTAHRKLGEVGQKFGSSLILSHFKQLPSGRHVLNIANTGLGEAILLHGKQAEALVSPHFPSSSKQEVARITEQMGFISEDDRVNGICGVSRLLGCFYLHPHVIPLPNTRSVELPLGPSCLIMATQGLWKHATLREIQHIARTVLRPTLCAKKLADLAVASGSQLDTSVLVIRLDLRRGSSSKLVHQPSTPELKSSSTQSTSEANNVQVGDSDEEDEPTNGITNVDDLLEGAFSEDEVPMDKSTSQMEAIRSISPEALDSLVMIHSPPSELCNAMEEDEVGYEEVQDSEDELILLGSDTEEPCSPPPVQPSSSTTAVHTIPVMDDYHSITLPREATKKPLFSLPTSFEMTQSVPALDLSDDGKQEVFQHPAVDRAAIEDFNTAISSMHSDEVGPAQQKPGVKVKRKRSFVQSSYARLSRHNPDVNDDSASFHSLQ